MTDNVASPCPVRAAVSVAGPSINAAGSDYRCGGGGGGGAIGGTGGRSAYIAWSGSMGSPITITRFGNATGGGGGYGVNITNYTGYNNGDGYVIIAPLAGPTGVYTA